MNRGCSTRRLMRPCGQRLSFSTRSEKTQSSAAPAASAIPLCGHRSALGLLCGPLCRIPGSLSARPPGCTSILCAGPTATRPSPSAATPAALLRCRYAAFSLELPSYLAATTHPLHDDFDKDTVAWVQRLAKGLDASYFEGLRVLAQHAISDDEHEITFEADVRPRDSPEGAGVTLHERSRFLREDGVWLYREGLDVSSKKR